MSTGRRGEKTYTGRNGVQSDRLRDLDKLAKTPAGNHGRLAAPSQQAIRGFIESQTCPWCGEGPYRLLAQHTRHAHGVSAAELREMAGVIKTASICSPDVSQDARRRGRDRGLPDAARVALAEYRGSGRSRVFSEAGLAVQRAKLDKARSPEQAKAAGGAAAAKRLAANREKRDEIIRLFRAGLPLMVIAERAGCCGATVKRALKREGVWEGDGRSLRWERNGQS